MLILRWGSPVSKFEQVSSDHHQMSLTGGSPGLVGGYSTWCFPGGSLPHDLSHDAFAVTPPAPMNRQMPMKTLSSHKGIYLRAVIIGMLKSQFCQLAPFLKLKQPFAEANMWFCSIPFVIPIYFYCFSLKDHLKTGSKDSASLNQMLHSPALVSINQKKV